MSKKTKAPAAPTIEPGDAVAPPTLTPENSGPSFPGGPPPIKLDSLVSALRARIGGAITLRVDGTDVVATGNQREARTPLDGRYPNEICDSLVKGLL